MKNMMMMALATTALGLAGCGSKTTTTDQTVAVNASENDSAMAPAAMAPGQVFANAAASSDAYEIATSELAKTSASAAKVKSYATAMITAHNASTAKLKTVAAGLTPAIVPDPALTPEQQGKLDGLKGKTGKDFDTAYAAAQIEAHQMTLDKLKDYAATGDVPALKTFASGLAPTVAAHLNMAKGL